MTSPSAAHTGIVSVATPDDFAAAAEAMATRLVVDYGTNANPSPEAMLELALAAVQPLIDAGDASWCPVCGGAGEVVARVLPHRAGTRPRPAAVEYATCTRCRGGRLNPFHGCTFTTDDPCACTTRCQVYQPQETPTP